MERTIDGIDYIAKSEVLRIIDEEISIASKLQLQHAGDWLIEHGCHYQRIALENVRARLFGTEEM